MTINTAEIEYMRHENDFNLSVGRTGKPPTRPPIKRKPNAAFLQWRAERLAAMEWQQKQKDHISAIRRKAAEKKTEDTEPQKTPHGSEKVNDDEVRRLHSLWQNGKGSIKALAAQAKPIPVSDSTLQRRFRKLGLSRIKTATPRRQT